MPNPSAPGGHAPSGQEPRALDWALHYVAAGLAVLPLHSVRSGGCTCGDRECRYVGKHPFARPGFARNGVHDATLNGVKVQDWFGAMPSLNVGIATGRTHAENAGVLVVDGDPKNGGLASMKALADEFPALRDTPVQLTGLDPETGQRGVHVFLSFPAGTPPIPNSKSALAPGIDVRGDGGYVVASPSMHRTGVRYEWRRGPSFRAYLKPCPDALLERILGARKTDAGLSSSAMQAGEEVIAKGTIHDTLVAFGGLMRRYGATEAEVLAVFYAMRERCEEKPSDKQLAQWASSVCRYAPGTGKHPVTPIPVMIANIVKSRDEVREEAVRRGYATA